MTCKKCGAELRPGTLYCTACGSAAGPAPFLDTDPVPGADKKKRPRKKRAGLIVLIVCLVLAAAAGVAFRRVIGEFFLRTFRSPADYYQHVEARAIDELSERVGKAYALFFLSEDGKTGRAAELTVAPKTDALSWVEGLTVRAEAQTNGSASQAKLAVTLNGQKLADATAYMDEDGLAAQIPLLNDSYVRVDNAPTPGDSAVLLDALRTSGLTQDEVTALTKKMLTCIVQELDDVSKSRGTVEAEEISQRCTVLHVTISAQDAEDIRAALDEMLRADASVKKLLDAACASGELDRDDCVDMVVDAVVSAIADGGEMDVSVAANGDVIGRELRLANDAELSYARPVSLTRRMMGLAVRVRGTNANELALGGTLQKDAGELTCDVTVDGDSESLYTLAYSALDVREDAVSADFRLELADGVDMLIPETKVSTALKGAILDGSVSAEPGAITANADVEALGMELASVSLRTERIESASFSPVTDALSFEEWSESNDLTGATKELTAALKKAGVPALTLAQLLLQVFSQGAEAA